MEAKHWVLPAGAQGASCTGEGELGRRDAMTPVEAMVQEPAMSWDTTHYPPHCTRRGPCSRHAAEARAAAAAAEAQYRAERERMPARDVARGAQGSSAYGWQSALERPLTPCDDGLPGLGWPDEDA